MTTHKVEFLKCTEEKNRLKALKLLNPFCTSLAVKGPDQPRADINRMITKKLGKIQNLVLSNQKIPEWT